MKARLSLAVAALAIGLIAAPLGASPPVDVVSNWAVSDNLTARGYSPRVVPLDNTVPGAGLFNSDLAFWGDMVVAGTYEGFRLIDATYPSRPKEILNYKECAPGSTLGNQGDVIIYGNILIRSWNSNTPASGATCDGDPVEPGFEGLHVFDISNKQDPDLVASVNLECGSHTATAVPDTANGRLLVYNSPSSTACPGIDIVDVPLANPAGAAWLRLEPAGRSCHDTAVILGDAMKVACAGGNGTTVFSLKPADGGSLTDPAQLWSVAIPAVSIGHAAAFTYDGKYVVFGHEPGGGSQAQCQATSSITNRSLFFFEADTGASAGSFVHPRPQTATENCTWHNFNIVPLREKDGKPRYVLVAGNYQSGLSVVDFSNPANAQEIAYADPPPLVNPQDPAAIELGGDWSTYWYNGRIYENDITRGLIIWRLDDDRVSQFVRTPYLNPQTAEFTIHQ